MAAQQGVALAQTNLGLAYWQGKGLGIDKREAYIWYSIAQANGDESAAKYLRENYWPLSKADIHSAREEAARRLESIENR